MNKEQITALTIAGFIIFGGVGLEALLDADNVYSCDDNKLIMQCDKLSKYYGLPNGKCYNEELGNKLCRSGWDKLESNEILEPIPMPSGKKWECSNVECVEI